MASNDNVLTIVEPTTGGDATLELARDAMGRGGTASVVLLITDRVRRDIRDFAESEDLDLPEAEARALDQLERHYGSRLAGSQRLATYFGGVEGAVRAHVTDGTTLVAVPERLITGRKLRRLSSRTGVPVIPTPDNAA